MNTNEHENSVSMTPLDKNVKDKFEDWRNILLGEDPHSIRNQIYKMIWDSAVFQCINESREYAAINDEGDPKLNKMVCRFINDSFFKTQLLSIRGLMDKDRNNIRDDRQYTVYSLYNLIEDMKKNSSLLTRENILAFYNLPYDYEKTKAHFDNSTDWTQGPVVEPREIRLSQNIHIQIDSMAKTTAEERSPDDLIPDNIFRKFNKKLATIEVLYEYVNKYIAHPATPDSRKTTPSEIKEALGKVFNAHKIICETVSFIGNNLLFCGFGDFLPISQ